MATNETFRFPIPGGIRATDGEDLAVDLEYTRYASDEAVLPLLELGAHFITGRHDRTYHHNDYEPPTFENLLTPTGGTPNSGPLGFVTPATATRSPGRRRAMPCPTSASSCSSTPATCSMRAMRALA